MKSPTELENPKKQSGLFSSLAKPKSPVKELTETPIRKKDSHGS
jgi:hypothetical protein